MVRVNELLKREIAEALPRIMNERGFDLAAVTVTRVICGSDLKLARVMVSIRDHEKDKNRMLNLVRHHRDELREIIRKRITLRHIPQLTFEMDESIAIGDHVLQIISEIESELGPAGDTP